jgi:hypothetical protein
MGERIILRSVWSFSVPFKLCKLLLGGDEFWICGGLGSPRGASHERSSSDAINGSFTMLFEIVLCVRLRHFRTANLRKIAASN